MGKGRRRLEEKTNRDREERKGIGLV